jgi:polyisoprenoid-binding protein YceI
VRLAMLCILASAVYPSSVRAQVPIFAIDKADSSMKFSVSASVAIAGTFDKWDSTLTFTSTDLSSSVLDIKIQADSVNTGSGMKDGKLKGKDFFDAKQNPYITFHSTSVSQTGPTRLRTRETSRLGEPRSPRRSRLRLLAKVQALVRSREQWHSIARTME